MGGSTDWKIIAQYDKEPKFVEGFEMINDGDFIESVGQYWGSSIQKVTLDHNTKQSTAFLEKSLPKSFFGEGCTLFKNHYYQLTYRERKVFVYDSKTLDTVREMTMPSEMEEGWGLSHDEDHLYASDGTDQIFKINPENFSVVKTFKVADQTGKPIHYINELEVVGDSIFGNVLPLNVIIQIDKRTGTITNVYDFHSLFTIQMDKVNSSGNNYWDRMNNVMNGIAFRKSTGNLLVTGKNWNYIFEIELQ